MGNFHVKTQKSTDFAHTFSKNYIFFVFFNKDYTFYTKNLFIRPKNCFQSILYKEICKMFGKNQFSSNIFLIRPKNCVQRILYNERCKEFRKNQFSSNIFTFLSVICQNFEDNLRILGNFGKFSRKKSKIYGFRLYVFKKHFIFLIKIIVFYANNLFIRTKNCVQIIFYNEKYKKFR